MNRWIIALVLLSSCSKNHKAYQPKTQELRLNLHSEPPSLDPRRATDTVSISVISMCFEGLMRIDPITGQPIPAAAEKFAISEDGMRYVFTLRQSKWSDGVPVTAHDFEKTWKEMLNPSFPCEFASDLYILKNGQAAKMQKCGIDEIGVKAVDDRTLQIDLEHPVPFFLDATATHTFFATPAHITSDPNWVQNKYVGNGVFVLQKWAHHDSMVLVKNTNYWDAENTQLERVSLTLVEDETTELTMFENGELDWAGYPLSNLPTEALPSLKKKGVLESYDIAGTYYYVFNTKKFPFNNVNIRRAFSLAIDRQSIVTNVTQMGQTPAMGIIPPSMWRSLPYFKDNDVAEAQRLFARGLEELRIKREEFPEITLSYNTLIGHHKIAQAIQEQWHKAFGIRVKLENKEWKVFLDELRQHNFQVARMGGLATVNDPTTFLDFYRYLSSSNNQSQWNNPQYSELLEQADLTQDPEKRTALLKEAEKILIDEMPVAPIYFYTGAYVKKPYVKGIHLSEMNDLDLKWAHIDIDDQVSR